MAYRIETTDTIEVLDEEGNRNTIYEKTVFAEAGTVNDPTAEKLLKKSLQLLDGTRVNRNKEIEGEYYTRDQKLRRVA